MKRLLIGALALIAMPALTGCSPEQVEAWVEWNNADPVAAQAFLETPDVQALVYEDWDQDGVVEPAVATAQADRVNPPEPPPPPPSNARGQCSEWYDTAMDAGFSDNQWNTVDRIMFRESRCQPGARNPSGASGLMQIMPMWADDCGGSRSDLFNASFNLRCAKHILNVQGWGAWSTY